MSSRNALGIVQASNDLLAELGEMMGNSVAVLEHENAVAATGLSGLMRPVAPPDEMLRLQEETRELIAKTLKEGRDYGLVPGAKKNSLWKPGAERICVAFGCFPRYKILEGEVDHDRPVHWSKKSKKWNNAHKGDKSFVWVEETGESLGLYRYVIECQLVHRATNQVIGQAPGSCSTMEDKYIDRPRNLENTVLKMASKRSLVAVVLNTFGLSDQFTPEEEDADDAVGPPAEDPELSAAAAQLATAERRAELAELVAQLDGQKGLTRQALKTIKIAHDLARNENALAKHVAEGISMLETLKMTATPAGPPGQEELPFA